VSIGIGKGNLPTSDVWSALTTPHWDGRETVGLKGGTPAKGERIKIRRGAKFLQAVSQAFGRRSS